MRAARLLAIGGCLVVLGCEQDRARSVKIIPRPPSAAPVPAAVAPPAAGPIGGPAAPPTAVRPAQSWHPPGCPPPPGGANGPSSFTVTGPCAFQHRAAVDCEGTADDFLVTLSRQAARGATLMVYINVEFYRGPGSYTGAQMFVGVQDKTSIYRWSSDSVSITVGPDERFVSLPTTRVDVEGQLVGCSGPMNNYQCSARTPFEVEVPQAQLAEVVSGTMSCRKD
jgi:hypothetical protein